MVGTSKCEWFKLFLEPHALRDEHAVDPRLPEIPVRRFTRCNTGCAQLPCSPGRNPLISSSTSSPAYGSTRRTRLQETLELLRILVCTCSVCLCHDSTLSTDTAEVWLTVPAAWDAKGSEIMREAAIAAGLVASAHAGDGAWRDRLKIITEPEAAAVHCAHLTDLHHLKPSQNFIVCDAGGGTVDLAVYKVCLESCP